MKENDLTVEAVLRQANAIFASVRGASVQKATEAEEKEREEAWDLEKRIKLRIIGDLLPPSGKDSPRIEVERVLNRFPAIKKGFLASLAGRKDKRANDTRDIIEKLTIGDLLQLAKEKFTDAIKERESIIDSGQNGDSQEFKTKLIVAESQADFWSRAVEVFGYC